MGKNGSPLHHAASRGDFNLAKEIYEKTPQLAEATDNRGRLALHLTAARGNVEMVRLLMSNDDLSKCSARDADGWNPLHLAAMNGKVEVLNMLVQKCPHAAEARAGRGETILHICFKYNHKEAIKLLLENVKLQELVNAKDDDGNTLLHLAVADQNATATNKEGKILKKLKLDKKVAVSLVNSLREENARTTKELGRNNWVAEKRGSLMVVASLIATMAFQAGLTPPRGLFQDDLNTGESVLAVLAPKTFSTFIISNTIAVLGSLSVILLLISELPFKSKFFMWVLTVIMWATITAIAYTYGIAVGNVIPKARAPENETVFTLVLGVSIWVLIMATLLLIHTIRICMRLTKVRNFKVFIRKRMKKLGFRKPNTLRPGSGASAHRV